jgi:hypothetical protein
MVSFEYGGVYIRSLPLFIGTCVTAAVNIVVMSVNFLLGGKAQRGKYPPCYIVNKILLLPFAGAIWYQITTDFSWKIIAYIIGCWLGDTLLFANLRGSRIQWLMSFIGAWCFAFSHMIMMWYFNVKWSEVPAFAYLFLIPSAIAVAALVPYLKFQNLGDHFIVLYYLILQAAFLCSIGRLCQYPVWHPSFLMCSIGYVFFLISDTCLLRKEFSVDTNPRRFETMSTYAVGQVLILAGAGLSLM